MNPGRLKISVALATIFMVAAISCVKNHSSENHSSSEEMDLLGAVESGDLNLVKTLVKEGAPINERYSRRFEWTPLIGAIFQNDTNMVTFLVGSGADVNLADINGVTPLMWATARGDDSVPLVAFLIDHGAKLDAKDKYGGTALDAARGAPPKPKLVAVLEAAKLNEERKAGGATNENRSPK